MWRRWCSSSNVMKQSLAVFFRHACPPPAAPSRPFRSCRYHSTFSVSAALSNAISESLSEKQNVHFFCSSSSGEPSGVKKGIEVGEDSMSFVEAKKLLRLVNVEALKMKLEMEGEEIIRYPELLDACKSMGLARSLDEAVEFARVLDKAGVVLLFRDKVYLHPNKVVDLVRKAVPIALTPENDPMQEELNGLQEKKKEIDSLAHKQVRHILWTGLAIAIAQVGLFFRLTFWEFSWDVMEPVAFFITTTGLVVGYAYFLITSRDPTYQDFMKRLFLSRQRKLFKLHYFNVERFKELQRKCKPL